MFEGTKVVCRFNDIKDGFELEIKGSEVGLITAAAHIIHCMAVDMGMDSVKLAGMLMAVVSDIDDYFDTKTVDSFDEKDNVAGFFRNGVN